MQNVLKIKNTVFVSLLLWLGVSGAVWALDTEKARQQFSQTNFEVADVSEVSYDDAPAIGVTFSVPLAEGFEQYLNVSIKNGEMVSGGWILSDSATTAYFTHIDAVTSYTVTVYRGIKAVTDKALKKTFEQDVSTRPIQSSVAFASSGYVLPEKSSKGLPLYTINIAAVDVDFHRVKSDKVSQFIYQWANRQSQGSWHLERYKGLVDLVHSGRFDLNPPKNKRHRINLPVKNLATLQQPGVYMAVMKPAGEYPNSYQVTYFVVSDIGLHARFYPDRIDVYSNSIEQAKPMAGVQLTLLDRNGEVLTQRRVSPDGLGVFHNPPKKARILLAQRGEQIALLELLGPALDLSAFDLGQRQQRPTEAFIYGPRDLYRPGEKVVFNALLRDADAQLVASTPLRAILRSADGREVQNTIWHGDELSYYTHDFQLPSNAPTGRWHLQLKIGSKVVGDYGFKVEEFLPERMALTLDDGIKKSRFFDVISQGDLTLPVEGAYLYGAPAAKNRLNAVVTVSQQRHPLEILKDYHFGNIQEHARTQRFDLGDKTLDDEGKTLLSVRNRWRGVNSPLDIHVVASLFESGGRPVVRDIHYTTWPKDSLIGIRPLFKEDELDSNSMAGFEVIKADQQGRLQAADGLEVKLVRERRNYYWVYSDGRGWQREYTDKHYAAFSTNLSIEAGKHAQLDVPVEWGGYRLEVRDPSTGVMTSLRFRAGWWYSDADQGSSARPDRVELKLDKRHYQNGDVAKVTITAPYAGEGFVLLEGDQPLYWQRINVPEGGVSIEIPVDDEWRQHNLYLSAVVFRPSQSESEHMPNRAMGLLHFPLDRESRQLTVSVAPLALKVAPETTLTTRIKIDGVDASDKPVMVTLAAVDVGVLNITDFETPDAHQWFFEPRRYSIDSRDMYSAIIDSLDGDLATQRFGGDADLSRGGKKAQSEVQIVSLFSGAVTVDENGEADVPFELPDFNGRLRLMALAFNGEEYGSAEAEVTVAAPIIAEIAMPRFLANGDQSTLTLDLHNLSGAAQTLTLNTSATPPLSLDSETQRITLADGEKRILSYPLSAVDAFGAGEISVSVVNDADADTDKINLNRHWRLNVRPAYPAITQRVRKVLNAGDSLVLNKGLDDLIVDTVAAELTVSTQPPMELNHHLKQLLRYPYGCLEQTISSTYPWVYATPGAIDRLGLDEIKSGKVDMSKRLDYLTQGLDRIRNLQLSSGGFGLWSNADSEQHWLTTYVADFLTDVREQGVTVDQSMLNQTMKRLTQYVNTTGGMFGERWSQSSGHYRFAYRAYAAYVLSKANRAPLGSLRNMFDQQRSEVKTGLPLVHLGLALIKQGDRKRGMQAIEEALNLSASKDRYTYYGDYGSTLRELSLMVYLLEHHDVKVVGRADLIFKLADAASERQWLSTQERLALFKAGVMLSKNQNNAWAGELLLGKTSETLSQAAPYQRIFEGGELVDGFVFNSNYNEKLFSQLILTGYSTQAPTPRDKDIWVARDYYDVDGNMLAQANNAGVRSLPELEIGDLVVVHLRVNADRRIPDALLVDLLPAGLELENQNLDHAVKLDKLMIDGKRIDELQRSAKVKHQEYRDDRFVAAFDLHDWGYTDLFYLARAVTPGTYTVPPTYVEDMYRPFIQNVSHAVEPLVIVNKKP